MKETSPENRRRFRSKAAIQLPLPGIESRLACLKEAGAQFIVSGDRYLLQLGHCENIRMLTASRFREGAEDQ